MTVSTEMHRRLRLPLITWSAIVVTALLLAMAAHYIYTRDSYWILRWAVDFKVYYASGQAVRHGTRLYDLVVMSPLYGPMPYLYPPMTAILFFVPLSFLKLGTAMLLWNALSLVALGAVVRMSLRIGGVRDEKARSILTIVGMILAACLMPVRIQLIAGQINMFLLLLVLIDFRPNAGRWRGVGVGIAAGLKITPLIFIGYFVVTRQWKAARNATLSFLGTVLIGLAIEPRDSIRYWGGTVLQSSRAGGVFDTPNQSLSGAMARVLTKGEFNHWWLVVLALVAIGGLAVARYAYLRGSDFLGYAAAAITGLLVSPISWEHHWVYMIPFLIWLACRAYQKRDIWLGATTVLLVAIFTIRLFMLIGIPESPPAPMDLPWWKEIVGAMYPVTGLLLLLIGPLWIQHNFPDQQADGTAGPAGLDAVPAATADSISEPQPEPTQEVRETVPEPIR